MCTYTNMYTQKDSQIERGLKQIHQMWQFQGHSHSKEGTVDCLDPDPSRLTSGSEAKIKAKEKLQLILMTCEERTRVAARGNSTAKCVEPILPSQHFTL